VAIERNPCEDALAPCPPGQVRGDDGVCRPDPSTGTGAPPGPAPGPGNGQPTAVDDQPEVISAPFPRPFQRRRNIEEYEPHTIPDPAPYARTFATATRSVTVVPNTLAMTDNSIMLKAISTLNRSTRQDKDQLNNGKLWFQDRPSDDRKEADLFRWSLFNFWVHSSPPKREALAFKPCSGNENPWATPTQDIEMPLFDAPYALRFYNGPDITYRAPVHGNQDYSKYYRPPEQIEEKPPAGLVMNPMSMFGEEMRFCFYNDASKSFVKPGEEQTFLERYAPSALIENTEVPARTRLQALMYMHLFGADSELLTAGNYARSTQGLSPAAKNYFDGTLKGFGRPIQRDINFWTLEPYRDYVFDAPVAFFEEELNGMLMSPFHSAKITKKVGNVDFVNLKGYIDEREVPNVYSYYNSIELKKDFEEAILKDSSRVEEDILSRLGVTNILNAYRSLKKVRRDTDGDGVPDTPAAINMIYKTPSTLKFPSDRVEKLEKINEFMKGYAENYVEISINTTQGGHISSLLQKSKLDRVLMDVMYPPPPMLASQWSNYSKKIKTKATMILDDSFKTSNPSRNSIESTLNDRKVSDIPIEIETQFYPILKKILPESPSAALQDSKKQQYPLFYYGWDNVPMLRLEDAIRSQVFCKELEEYVANAKLQRSYADLLSGEKAYSEVVGYNVHKYEVLENGEENLIQSFILMDSNEIDTINFLDSQVIPFKKYKYKIFSINFVLATEYKYDSNVPAQAIAPFVDIKIYTQLAPYLIEAPFFEETVEIRDMPPMTPQVSFLPTQGVDDKIKILLTTNYGEVTEPWYDPDADKEMLKTKYGMDRDGLITFKTDSLPSSFLIHRLEEPPESYKDFEDSSRQDYYVKRIAAVSNAGISMEDLEPNKYYYYTFRAYDNWEIDEPLSDRAMASNPTEVFRIRMVSYANGIFLEMDPYEMKKEVRADNIVFERLLKINPNFDQTMVDYSNTFDRLKGTISIPSNSIEAARQAEGLMTHEQYIAGHHEFQKSAPNPDELKLGSKGSENHSVWSKKFKIRIRSKDSGKMVDLNVKFVQNVDDLKREE
jgi:hypothetical protein